MSRGFICDHCGEIKPGQPAGRAEIEATASPEGALVEFCEGCWEEVNDYWGVLQLHGDSDA